MSDLIIPLNPLNPLLDGKRHREGFFARKQSGDRYWLGHIDSESGDIHETRVSEEFFIAFIKENEKLKAKYLKILKSNSES